MQSVQLNSGNSIPALGFGTWQVAADQAQQAVGQALAAGYRLLDTAKLYGNEREVGEAVRASGMPREEIFVTTKLWNDDQGYDTALAAFDTSLEQLDLGYVDLYLIHWPTAERERRLDSWEALKELHKSGRARDIGVSNYSIENLQEILQQGDVVPAVNQIEFHPYNFAFQKSCIEFCQRHGIVVEAYSPLRRFTGEGNKIIESVAAKVGRQPSQVILRWCIQHGAVPLPRSTNLQHIQENLDVFDFELSPSDMQALDGVGPH